MVNTLQNMQMQVTFKCRFCETVVIEKTMPQDEAMKAMNVSYTKIHKVAVKNAAGQKFFRERGGHPVVMGKTITEDVPCPGCHLPVIVPSGVGRGIHGTYSLTSVNTPQTEEVV